MNKDIAEKFEKDMTCSRFFSKDADIDGPLDRSIKWFDLMTAFIFCLRICALGPYRRHLIFAI